MKSCFRFKLVLLLFLLASVRSFGQIDTIFWFAVPEVSVSAGESPIFLRLSAASQPSNVVVSVPRLNMTLATVTVNYGTSTGVDLTPWLGTLECLTPDVIRDWGICIQASEPITAYYEVSNRLNPELFTLKGNHALGTRFITPFQTRYNNTASFNGECWSSIDIVATEDNTTVNITPSTAVVNHAKGVPFSVVLQKGQTYSTRDVTKTKTTGNLSGTLITSDKNISVNLKDDGAEIAINVISTYRDLIGDLMMSFEHVGSEYIVVKGDLNPNDYIYIVGTENATTVLVNGVSYAVNAFQTIEAPVSQNVYIKSDKPVYAYHLTGSEYELGSAILPSIQCNGSAEIAFTRSSANKAYLLIAVPTSGTDNFLFNGSTTLVPATAFTPVPLSPGWSAAKIDLTASMIVGSNFLKNTESLFHMALINGDNASGGTAYGYFSNYKAEIYAGKDTTICPGTTLSLFNPGVYYPFEYVVHSGDMNSIIGTTTVKPTITTTYVLRRLGDCNLSDTIVVTINDLKADAGRDTSICTGTVRLGGKPAATGGKPAYTYSWTGGSTADSLIAGPGTYTLTVTDKYNCKATDVVTVTSAAGFTITGDFIKPSCKGDLNGKAFVKSISGGRAPFTYLWSGGQTTDTITAGAGSYKVVVTDKNGCKDSTVIVMTEPARLDIDTVVTQNACPQVSTGNVVASASGGTAPYQFNKDNGVFTSTSTFNNLAASTFIFRVKDAKGCQDSATVIITSGMAPMVTAPNDTIVCPGNQLVFGGSSTSTGLNYSWTGGISNGVAFSATSTKTYVLTGTDANGCKGTDSTLVTVKPVPDPTIGPFPSIICSDTTSIQLSAATSGGNWRGPGVNASSGLFSPTTAGVGLHTIIYEIDNGCKASDTVKLTVSKRMDARINPAGPFCTNASIQQLTSTQTGGTWSGNGVNSSGQFNPASAGIGMHQLSYSLGGACPDTKSITISVNSVFDPTILPGGPFCASDDTVQLRSATPGASWSGKGIIDAALGIFDPRIAGPGTHTITHFIAGSCGGTDTEQFTVLPLDTVHISAPNDSICYNAAPMVLTADKSGGTWSGTVSTTGVFNPAGQTPGTYKIYYSYQQNCLYTDSITITIPDTLKANMANGSVNCFGDMNGSLSANQINGSAPFTYSWADNATITTANRSNLSVGNYQVTITDALGCQASVGATIIQPSALVFTSILTTIDSCYQSKKGSVTFTATGGTPSTTAYPYSYSISPVAGSLNTSQNGFTGLGAGSYTVTLTDNNGCTQTAAFAITEAQLLQVYASALPDYCAQAIGSCTVDSARGGTLPYSYNWQSGPSGSTYPGRTAGVYNVAVTDSYGCIATDTALVNTIAGPTVSTSTSNVSCNAYSDGTVLATVVGGTGSIVSSWSDGLFPNQFSRAGLKADLYWLEVTDAKNCSNRDTFLISQPSAVKMGGISNAFLCYGIPFTGDFAANGGNPGSYSFFMNNVAHSTTYELTAAGTYTAFAVDSKGCYSDTISFTLTSNPDISAGLSPNPTVCPGATASFTGTASGGNGNYSYGWDQTPISNSNTRQYTTSINNQSPIPVNLVVSDGCSKSDTVNGLILFYPVAIGALTVDDKDGCYPLTVNFTIGGNLNQYAVNDDKGNFLGATSNFSHTYLNEGVHSIILSGTTSNGCMLDSTTFAQIIVHGYPTADFTWNPQEPTTVDNLISLINLSIGEGNTYNWIGLDTTATDTVFTSKLTEPLYYMPSEAGIYPLHLLATNQFGCSDSITYFIRLKEEVTVYIPNTFTPNDDGYNELFIPIYSTGNISRYLLQIFDRWGQVIFSSESPTVHWDGTLNGEPCKPDVYPYRLTYAEGSSSGKKQILGRINLIR